MKGVSLQTDEAHQALEQPVLTAQRDYLSEKLEFEAYKLRMEKKTSCVLCVVLLRPFIGRFMDVVAKVEAEENGHQ